MERESEETRKAGCWIINVLGLVEYTHFQNEAEIEMLKQIGNFFNTEEEAERAREKREAITRLSEWAGLKFEGYDDRDRGNGGDIVIYAHIDIPHNNLLEEAQPAMLKDLDLIFGGKE